MKTIESTGPLLISVSTDGVGVPKGKVHVRCVRYETYEFDSSKELSETTFSIHDSNHPSAREWISSKIIPTPYKTVITYQPYEKPDSVWIGYHDGQKWRDEYGAEIANGLVESWIPFPKSPPSENT